MQYFTWATPPAIELRKLQPVTVPTHYPNTLIEHIDTAYLLKRYDVVMVINSNPNGLVLFVRDRHRQLKMIMKVMYVDLQYPVMLEQQKQEINNLYALQTLRAYTPVIPELYNQMIVNDLNYFREFNWFGSNKNLFNIEADPITSSSAQLLWTISWGGLELDNYDFSPSDIYSLIFELLVAMLVAVRFGYDLKQLDDSRVVVRDTTEIRQYPINGRLFIINSQYLPTIVDYYEVEKMNSVLYNPELFSTVFELFPGTILPPVDNNLYRLSAKRCFSLLSQIYDSITTKNISSAGMVVKQFKEWII